jgi:hypothetical protein
VGIQAVMLESPLFITENEREIMKVGKEKKWGLVRFWREIDCQNFTLFPVMGKVGKDFKIKL